MDRRCEVLGVARLVLELSAEVGLLIGSAVPLDDAQLQSDIITFAFLLFLFLVGVSSDYWASSWPSSSIPNSAARFAI